MAAIIKPTIPMMTNTMRNMNQTGQMTISLVTVETALL